MGRKNKEEDVIDAHQRQHIDEYVDVIGNFTPSDLRNQKKKQIKKAVLKEVQGHKQIIQEAPENAGNQTQTSNLNANGEGNETSGNVNKENAILLLMIIRYIITGVLFPIFDIGSDLITGGQHFYYGDPHWGALTLFFVAFPGLVAGVSVLILGLRREFTIGRLINFSVFFVLSPIIYPIASICINAYMVYLMIVQKSRAPERAMVFDVKQFKSLEGFLESGPQFVLQLYILLHRPLEEDRVEWIALSICFSLASLVKTCVNVNRPDPDSRRTHPQTITRPIRFLLTSLVFHLFTVLFRLISASYFFATVREYTAIIIFATVIINMVLLYINCKTSTEPNYVVIVLLGLVSAFAPNGYLLYNFAAIFPVDFTFQQTKRFLSYHMTLITSLFLGCTAVIMGCVGHSWLEKHVPDDSFLDDTNIQYGFGGGLLFLGVMSIISCFFHWKLSIEPLYGIEEDGPEVHQMQQDDYV